MCLVVQMRIIIKNGTHLLWHAPHYLRRKQSYFTISKAILLRKHFLCRSVGILYNVHALCRLFVSVEIIAMVVVKDS